MTEEEHLIQADHHISEAEWRIDQQEQRISQLRRHGRDTALAQRLLEVLHESWDAMQVHRQFILKELARYPIDRQKAF